MCQWEGVSKRAAAIQLVDVDRDKDAIAPTHLFRHIMREEADAAAASLPPCAGFSFPPFLLAISAQLLQGNGIKTIVAAYFWSR